MPNVNAECNCCLRHSYCITTVGEVDGFLKKMSKSYKISQVMSSWSLIQIVMSHENHYLLSSYDVGVTHE